MRRVDTEKIFRNRILKSTFFVSTIVAIVVFFCCQPQKEISDVSDPKIDYYVDVIGISDGDSFHAIDQNKQRFRFRIQGIDAPEKGQPYSQKSKQKLSGLIYQKRVGIKVHKKQDRYGRPVVYVFTPDGRDAGAEMLRAGLAWHFKRFDNSEEYATLENQARQKRLGLWQDDNPIPPWEWRE